MNIKEYRLDEKPNTDAFFDSLKYGRRVGVRLRSASIEHLTVMGSIVVESLSNDHQPDGMWAMTGRIFCVGLGYLEFNCTFGTEEKFKTDSSLLTVKVPERVTITSPDPASA